MIALPALKSFASAFGIWKKLWASASKARKLRAASFHSTLVQDAVPYGRFLRLGAVGAAAPEAATGRFDWSARRSGSLHAPPCFRALFLAAVPDGFRSPGQPLGLVEVLDWIIAAASRSAWTGSAQSRRTRSTRARPMPIKDNLIGAVHREQASSHPALRKLATIGLLWYYAHRGGRNYDGNRPRGQGAPGRFCGIPALPPSRRKNVYRARSPYAAALRGLSCRGAAPSVSANLQEYRGLGFCAHRRKGQAGRDSSACSASRSCHVALRRRDHLRYTDTGFHSTA